MCYGNVEGYLFAHGLKPPTPYPQQSSFFEAYLQACRKDPDAKRNHYYFDIMNQHSYGRATDLYDYAEVDWKLMRDYLHEEKPIWFTEMGYVDKNNGPFGGTPDEYCDYLLQAFAWGSSAGVERFFHFQLDNSNGHGLYAAMLGDPKPALTTYRDVLTYEFADAVFVAQLHGNKGIGFLSGKTPYTEVGKAGYDLFEFKSLGWEAAHSDGVCGYGPRCASVQIPAKTAHATFIDRHNNRTSLVARGGFYTLALSGAVSLAGWPTADDPKGKALGQPEHFVGGATSIIVEDLK